VLLPVAVTYTINPASPGVLTAKTSGAAPQAAEDDTSLAQRTLQCVAHRRRVPGVWPAAVVHALRAADGAYPVVDHRRRRQRDAQARPAAGGRLQHRHGAGLHRARRRGRTGGRRPGRRAAKAVGAADLRRAVRWRCRCSTSTSCSFPAPCKAA
jgi:hypothetical protein